MRCLLFCVAFLMLLASALTADATLTYVQSPQTSSCSTSSATCAITVTSTGGGDVGVMLVDYGASTSKTISSMSCGANAWTRNPTGTGQFLSAASGGAALAYNLNLSAGVTSCSVTMSGIPAFGWDLQFWEYRHAGAVSLDSANGKTISTAQTNPTGIAFTLTGTNDVIVQQMVFTASPSAINLSYGHLNTSQAGADLENTTTGTAPTWTAASGTGIANAIAIKEAPSTACRASVSLLGAGGC